MVPKDTYFGEIKNSGTDRRCYLCRRTEEESLRDIGMENRVETLANEVKTKRILAASEVARINAQRLTKMTEIKQYLESLLGDASGYPDNMPLEEVLSNEETAVKLMPRVKDLLKYVGRTHLIPGSLSISKDGYINIGYIKQESARFIKFLDNGEFPDDLKKYEPDMWESVKELPLEKIPENFTVVKINVSFQEVSACQTTLTTSVPSRWRMPSYQASGGIFPCK